MFSGLSLGCIIQCIIDEIARSFGIDNQHTVGAQNCSCSCICKIARPYGDALILESNGAILSLTRIEETVDLWIPMPSSRRMVLALVRGGDSQSAERSKLGHSALLFYIVSPSAARFR